MKNGFLTFILTALFFGTAHAEPNLLQCQREMRNGSPNEMRLELTPEKRVILHANYQISYNNNEHTFRAIFDTSPIRIPEVGETLWAVIPKDKTDFLPVSNHISSVDFRVGVWKWSDGIYRIFAPGSIIVGPGPNNTLRASTQQSDVIIYDCRGQEL